MRASAAAAGNGVLTEQQQKVFKGEIYVYEHLFTGELSCLYYPYLHYLQTIVLLLF